MSEQTDLASLRERIIRARNSFANGLTITILGTMITTLGLVYWRSAIAIFLGILLSISGGYIMLCYDIKESGLAKELKGTNAQIFNCPSCGKEVLHRNLAFCPFCGKALKSSSHTRSRSAYEHARITELFGRLRNR